MEIIRPLDYLNPVTSSGPSRFLRANLAEIASEPNDDIYQVHI